MKLFLLGTGTGVGKTTVGQVLLEGLRALGVGPAGLKLVETGGTRPFDWELLGGPEAVPPFRHYPDPVSPHLGARKAGEVLSADELLAFVRGHERPWTVLESAGGSLSPLSENLTNGEFAARLGFPTVLVCPGRLGVLHDVGATLLALRTFGVSPAVLVCAWAGDDGALVQNAEELRRVVVPRFAAGVPVVTLGERTQVDSATWTAGLLDRLGAGTG